jgi:glucose/arabinose dehydrogenase
MNKSPWSMLTGAAIILLAVTCQVSKNSLNKAPLSVQEDMAFATPRVVDQNPSPLPLTPEQSLQTFRLPKGYRLELVASEPMISEPVALTWDGNGKMYVAQMETYMQTVDTTGEHVSTSRVMLLEDTNNDGKMDKSSVFIDKLMLPRMVLCVGDELIVNETDTYDMYAYKDTNGDGIADQKRQVYKVGKKAPGNLEHQRSGLDWNLDNWIYVTVDPVRFRYVNNQLVADTLVSGSNGQWGLTHDNYGRLFFSRGGGENAGSGFQINPVYGQLEFKDAYIDSTFGAVWPIIKTPDIQGGLKRLRPDSTLNHFTSANGQSVFAATACPIRLWETT